MMVRLHAIEYASRANGPGLRSVVWFQGCTLGCHGCFNPSTHPSDTGTLHDTAKLASELMARHPAIEGVSISGGEPFQQPKALHDLLERLAAAPLSVLVFSGYTLSEIQLQPLGPQILRHIDVLIAGRYVAPQHAGAYLLGSANQKIHLLTDRYGLGDIQQTPQKELILHADGSITSTGILPVTRREPNGTW